MLVSKSAIQREFGKRAAEFVPPGEQLQGLFEAEYGDTPFLNPTGNPLFVLLTGNYVLFVGAKRMTNNPTQTLATIPRQLIRFAPPDNGIAHFWVLAQMQDAQGQARQLRLKIHKMWREEATALVAAVNAPPLQQGQPAQAYPQQRSPQYPGQQQAYPQGQQPYPGQPQPYPGQGGAYPGQPAQHPPYQHPHPAQPQQPPYPPDQGRGWS
jgi:hypothetical protein